jgi:simple sugar transport system permease protein
VEGSNNTKTAPLDETARFPILAPGLRRLGIEPPQGTRLGGFVIVALVVGVGYWLLLSRSRFGFELRATGLSPSAAVASGVDAKRMTIAAMLLSGALAGLVGLPQLLGTSFAYGLDFTSGLGFTGIGVALLGRGSPVGIGLAALLFAFLERSSATLQRIDVPTEIYVIMQGSIVLSVVVAYEAVRRIGVAQAERAVRRATDPGVAA